MTEERPLPPAVAPLLRELKRGLETIYGDRLERVILYGSYARGDAHPASDIDVMVVLRGAVDAWKELGRMSEVATEVQIEAARMVTLFPVSTSRFAEGESPLLINVRQDGVPV